MEDREAVLCPCNGATTHSVSSSQPFVCVPKELTIRFLAELTEFAPKLSEAQ